MSEPDIRHIQRIGPVSTQSSAVGQPCAGCHKSIAPGDFVALVPIGPGDSKEDRELARRGVAFNAVAVLAHFACVTGIED